MIETMKSCYANNNYIICPHTAVGVAYLNNNNKQLPQIVLATASPDKFPEAVVLAGITPNHNPSIAKLNTMQTRFDWMKIGDDWESQLRAKIESISSIRH